jgi:hypothetical protein
MEIPMKKIMAKITWLILGLAIASFLPVATHGQAETGADDFKSNNTVPAVPGPAAKTEFKGHFTLPFQVQCHGNKLAPGEYTLMVKTVGEDKMVTFQREGSDVVLKSHPLPPTSVSDQGKSAVLLRHGPGPGGHTLEGVYLENLKLVLFLDDSGHTKFMDKMFAGLKRVPIS